MATLLVPGAGLVEGRDVALIPGAGLVNIEALQYGRPSSDVSAGDWSASTGTDLYAMLDESPYPSDADYIYTATNSACTVALSSVTDPQVATDHTVRYRAKGNGSADLVVTLLQTSTEIASWTETNASSTMTDYEHALTTGQAASITDYTALRLKFTATG